MLGIVFLFTGLISSLLPINGTPLRDRDLDLLLNVLKNQVGLENTSEDSSSTSASEDSQHEKNMKVIELIQHANKLKNRANNGNKNQRYTSDTNAVDQNYHYHQQETKKDDISAYDLKERDLEQLLQDKKIKLKKVHQRLTPNRLLNYDLKDAEYETQNQIGGLDQYSKIYLILDPIAIQKNKDSIDLPSLVSEILSQSSYAIGKTRPEINRTNRYKGFKVKDNTGRRFRRESKEMYGGDGGGDMDDDYNPKRQKHEYGGGSGGGRTAIPYIRHRGDIYERDH